MPKSVLRAFLGRIQFTLHATRRTPHGASRLVQAISAWLVKTRRAPSRHSRNARVYGHTTTAIHKLSTPPPSPVNPLPPLGSQPLRCDGYDDAGGHLGARTPTKKRLLPPGPGAAVAPRPDVPQGARRALGEAGLQARVRESVGERHQDGRPRVGRKRWRRGSRWRWYSGGRWRKTDKETQSVM